MQTLILALLAAPGHVGQTPAGLDFSSAFPADTLAYVESSNAHGLLVALSEHGLLEALRPEGGWLSEIENADEVQAVLERLEERAGRPALSVLEDLGAGGAALGFGLRRLKPSVTFVLEGASEERVDAARQLLFDVAVELEPGLRSVYEEVEEREGARLWRLPDAIVGQFGARVGVGVDEHGLLLALGATEQPERRQLGASEPFVAAFDALPEVAEGVRAWVALEKLVAASRLGGEQDLVELAQLVTDPGAQGLLGPGLSSFGRARSLAATLDVGGGALDLRLTAESLDEVGASLRPSGGPAQRLDEAHPGQLGHAVLYRDYATLTDRRAELIAPESLPPFSAQLAELDVLFGGLRLAEDVLPDLDPWLEVVSRPIAADAHTAPGIELPAVAVLLSVADAEHHGPVLESALQNLTALSNVERAQNGLRPMLMRLQREGERSWSTARWPDLPEGETAGLEYNLAPAWACVGECFVVASHESLLIDLFDELEAPIDGATAEAPAKRAGAERAPIERLQLAGPVLSELAAKQLGRLSLASALSEGGDSTQAAARIRPLVEFAAGADLELEIGYRADALDARFLLLPTGEIR